MTRRLHTSSIVAMGLGLAGQEPVMATDSSLGLFVLTNGWPACDQGVPTVNEISGWVSEALTG